MGGVYIIVGRLFTDAIVISVELYPQIKECAEYFLFNFSEVCVTASTGLLSPSVTYPHSWALKMRFNTQ